MMKLLVALALIVAPLSWGVEIGKKVSDFTLPSLEGKQVSLKETLRDHDAVVVGFISTMCPYSNAYNARYEKFAKRLGTLEGKKVTFLAINSNRPESVSAIKKHAQKHGFHFTILKDAEVAGKKRVSEVMGALKTPEFFLISKNLDLLYHGRMDDGTEEDEVETEDLWIAVKAFSEGKPIAKAQTKAFGCGIK